MKWRTSLKSDLKRHALFKATFLGGAGVLVLILASIFMPPDQLVVWGFPLFIIGAGFIAVGMLPYRRLMRHESKPDELVLTDEETVIYYRQGKKTALIPLSCIEHVHYVDSRKFYGISLKFFPHPTDKVILYNRKQLQSLKGEFFLPYFSERTYKELVSAIRPDFVHEY